MENCSLMLSSTPYAKGETVQQQDEECIIDTSQVKIEKDIGDYKSDNFKSSTSSESPQPVVDAVKDSIPAMTNTDKSETSQEDGNCNNNRLSLEGSTSEVIDCLNAAIIHCSASPDDVSALARDVGTLPSEDGTNDSNSWVISIQQNSDKPTDSLTSDSCIDLETSQNKTLPLTDNCQNSTKENSVYKSEKGEGVSPKHLFVGDGGAVTVFPKPPHSDIAAVDKNIPQPVVEESVVPSLPNLSCPDNTQTQQSSKKQRTVESGGKLPSEPNIQFCEGGSQQQVPSYVQVDGNYIYDSDTVPGIDTLAETAMSQIAMMQQQSLEHSQFNLPHQVSMGRPVDVGWNHSVSDAPIGCPLASSTPEGVDGRRFTFFNQESQSQDGVSFVHAYQPLPTDPQSWQLQGKQGYLEHEQLQWMTNNLTGGPNNEQAIITFDQTPSTGRNWDAIHESVGCHSDALTNCQVYMYPPQQTTPLDMSPAAEPTHSKCQANMIQPRMSFMSETVGDVARPFKRSQSCLDSRSEMFHPAPKVAKIPSGNINSTAENYQISTNVHTLKPRHMVSWYIDHLIQENENVTQISKSYTIPVNIFNSKDMYYMEAVLKRVKFPSPKFLNWMQNNFPNINIHAIDFFEGRQPYFCTPFEEQARGKQRSEIIKETFFYFQQRKMN